jgi:hypothetical protein
MTRTATTTPPSATETELKAVRQRIATLDAEYVHPGEALRLARLEETRLEQRLDRERALALAIERDPHYPDRLARAKAAHDAATAELERLNTAAVERNRIASNPGGAKQRGWVEMDRDLELQRAHSQWLTTRVRWHELRDWPMKVLAASEVRIKQVAPQEEQPQILRGITLRPRLRDREDLNRVTVDSAEIVASVQRATPAVAASGSARRRARAEWDGTSV